jgi:predicted nucleic acid-binding protein
MILLDTNVIVDAQNKTSPFFDWSSEVVSKAVRATGAAINAVTLAELCAGRSGIADLVQSELERAGVQLLEVPAGAGRICGTAYRKYRLARRKSAGGFAPSTPFPDFFIGAHAEVMGWKLASRDYERFDSISLKLNSSSRPKKEFFHGTDQPLAECNLASPEFQTPVTELTS